MYSELLFEKKLAEVTYDDVVVYFSTGKLENQHIEFKSYFVSEKAKQQESHKDREKAIIRTICGFLNSYGGIIIWGSPEGKVVENEGVKDKEFLGALTPVPVNSPKDQFISKIVMSISPTPTGVFYHQIPCPEGGYIYIFEIERSLFPPHQYLDIYWMRLDGQTKAAPHHYIEALMKQVKHADIRGYVQNESSMTATRHGVVPFMLGIYNFSRYITAMNVSYSLICEHGIFFYHDEEINLATAPQGKTDGNVLAEASLHYNMPFGKKFYIALPESSAGSTLEIRLYIYADNSPMKVSTYQYQIFRSGSSPTPQIKLIQKEENLLSFEYSDGLGKTDEQRAIESNKMVAEQARDKWRYTPMYKMLDS